MGKRFVHLLMLIAVALGPTRVGATKPEAPLADPSAESRDPDPMPEDDSPAANWSRLSPEAYRAQRNREDGPANARALRRQSSTRPDWLVLDEPSLVTRKDAERVHRAGILLAAGIHATIAGAFAIGFGAGTPCFEGIVGGGAVVTTIGMGLNIGGIVAMARAPKEARRARKSRKHRVRMAGTVVSSAVASPVLAWVPGLSRAFSCD